MLLLGLVAAVAAAGGNAGAALLEAMAARRSTRAATVVLQPVYLAGLLLDIFSWVLTVIALRYMPIVAVQAIVAGQVAITVVASHWVFDTPLRRRDLVAAGANVLGLGFIVAAASTEESRTAGPVGVVALVVVFVVLLAVGVVTALRTAHAIVMAFLAGLAFSGVAVAVRLVDLQGSTGQVVRAALTDPVIWVLLAYGALGLALYTVALGRGAVGPVVGVLAVTETLAPGLLGLILLGDGVRSGWWPGLLLGLALALGGVVALARSPAQASLAGTTASRRRRSSACRRRPRTQVGPGPHADGARSGRRLLLERVLDLLARALEAAHGLVLLALGLPLLVVGGVAERLLGLALELLALVLDLVVGRHGDLPPWRGLADLLPPWGES